MVYDWMVWYFSCNIWNIWSYSIPCFSNFKVSKNVLMLKNSVGTWRVAHVPGELLCGVWQVGVIRMRISILVWLHWSQVDTLWQPIRGQDYCCSDQSDVFIECDKTGTISPLNLRHNQARQRENGWLVTEILFSSLICYFWPISDV